MLEGSVKNCLLSISITPWEAKCLKHQVMNLNFAPFRWKRQLQEDGFLKPSFSIYWQESKLVLFFFFFKNVKMQTALSSIWTQASIYNVNNHYTTRNSLEGLGKCILKLSIYFSEPSLRFFHLSFHFISFFFIYLFTICYCKVLLLLFT